MNTFIVLCRVDKLRLETLFEINPYFEKTKILKNARQWGQFYCFFEFEVLKL